MQSGLGVVEQSYPVAGVISGKHSQTIRSFILETVRMNGYFKRSLQLYIMEEQGLQHVVYDSEGRLSLYHFLESP